MTSNSCLYTALTLAVVAACSLATVLSAQLTSEESSQHQVTLTLQLSPEKPG